MEVLGSSTLSPNYVVNKVVYTIQYLRISIIIFEYLSNTAALLILVRRLLLKALDLQLPPHQPQPPSQAPHLDPLHQKVSPYEFMVMASGKNPGLWPILAAL